MAKDFMRCPVCRKQNKADGRYCIHCGSILSPVYCSTCGTANPSDLPQCLECGNPIPEMGGIRWKPVVTIIQPTSAMAAEMPPGPEREPNPDTDETSPRRGLLSRLRELFRRSQLQSDVDA